MVKTAGKKAVLEKQEANSGVLSKFRWGESYKSLFLGLIVVAVAAIIVFSLGRNNQNKQTSSTQDGPVGEKGKTENVDKDSKAQKTYIVKKGDYLWSISEAMYKSGYYWVEIARVNNLANPGLIYSGDKLIIPRIKTETKTSPIDKNGQNDATNTNLIKGDSYKVVKGDSLWNVAIRAYGDGYKWVDIARENKLANPDLIFSGNDLKLPR